MSCSDGFMYAASVIGYGRFGAMWSDILSAYFSAHGRVVAIADVKPISADVPSGLERCSLEHAVSLSEAIFLCVPISQMQCVLRNIAPLVHPQALVCDTCSVKVLPAQWMQKMLSETQKILATHPLFGPDSFVRNASRYNTIVCSPVRLSDEDYDVWIRRFCEMDLNPKTMSLEEHDRQAAYTQGLTHLLGRVLSALELEHQTVSTRGYEALLEIITQTCSDSSTLFQDMQNYNDYSKEMRHALQQAFTEVIERLR